MSSVTSPAIGGSNELTPLPPIAVPYLLVINIPLYRDHQGRRYAEELWFKDLAEHLAYIENLLIACPCIVGEPPQDAVSLDRDPRFSGVRFIDLRVPQSLPEALLLLPVTLFALWRAIRKAAIVHAGVAGWPFPLGWLAAPIARLLGKKSLIVVESAPWRLQPGIQSSLKARIQSSIFESMSRYCLRGTSLAIFTQRQYLESMLPGGKKNAHVINASWIDEGVILSDELARAIWLEKESSQNRELRILFVGQLKEAKGVLVLLDAMRLLGAKNVAVQLDILGQGSLAAQCVEASDTLQGSARVGRPHTVSYGPPLFEHLRKYHALALPTISDEQPRIVYDAYSQALPPLATRTAGALDCIEEGVSGLMAEPNDPIGLAAMIEHAGEHRDQLHAMGFAALQKARALTHQEMHRKRHRILLDLLR